MITATTNDLNNPYFFGLKVIEFLVTKFNLSEKTPNELFDQLIYFDQNEGGVQAEFIAQFPQELQETVRRRLEDQNFNTDVDLSLHTLGWMMELPYAEVTTAGKWWDKLWNTEANYDLVAYQLGVAVIGSLAEELGTEVVQQALEQTVGTETNATNENGLEQFLDSLSQLSGKSTEELHSICNRIRNQESGTDN